MKKLKFTFILNVIVLLCACNPPNEAKLSKPNYVNVTDTIQLDSLPQPILSAPIPPPPLPPKPPIFHTAGYRPPHVVIDSFLDVLSIKDDSPNGMPIYTQDSVPRPVICVDTVISNHKGIYYVVEQMPAFPTGHIGLFKYLNDSLRYPAIAQENGIEGKVYIRFVVDTTGQLTDIEVKRGVQGGCSEEAVRLIRAMPQWIPGKQEGKLVKVSYILPVPFKLE